MRTGAAGVIVGVGADSFSTGDAVLGIRVPLASAIADAAAARRDYLDETGGRYVHVIANGRIETSGAIARALACGADAVQLGEPLRIAAEAPGGGIWWDSVAAHPRLPRGGTSAPVAAGRVAGGRPARRGARPPTGAPTCSARCAARWPRPATATSRSSSGWIWSSAGRRGEPTDGLPDRPRRRLRRPVRAADRPADPRGRRLLGDRAERRPGRGDRSPASRPRSCCPAARPASTRPGAPQVDPTLFEAGVPAFGICYGFQAMAQSLGGTVAHTGDREYGGTPLTVTTGGPAVRLAAGRAVGLDEPRGRRRRGARRASPSPRPRPVRRWPRSRTSTASSPASSSTPRCGTPRTGRRCSSTSCSTSPASSRPGRWPTSSRSRSSGSARRSATAGRCARCPAASTPPSPRRWCSGRSVTGSPASTSTTG